VSEYNHAYTAYSNLLLAVAWIDVIVASIFIFFEVGSGIHILIDGAYIWSIMSPTHQYV
jgi:hypothetical protein